MNMSKKVYKRVIETAVNKKAYYDLTTSKKTKVSGIIESMKLPSNKQFKIPIQEYLKTNKLSTETKKTFFSLRSRQYNIKTNYKTMYENDMKCRICKDSGSVEDEVHTFFHCDTLVNKTNLDKNLKPEHIFGSLKQQISVMHHIMEVSRKREIIINLHNLNDT